MLCVVQEERIELLDKLEQFPLKIRVKEEQEGILRLAGFCSFSAPTKYVPLCPCQWAAFCTDVSAFVPVIRSSTPLSGMAIMPFVLLHCPVNLSFTVVL